MFTDSHCHLSYPDLHDQVPAILDAMAAAQVDRALCICTTLEEFEQVHALARDWPQLWATVGVHPDNEGVQEPRLEDLLERGRRPRVVAIGETGLDYYRLGDRQLSDMEWQRTRFRVHVRAALALNLPLVVHTRNAADDTLAILREEGMRGGAAVEGVFHCFTESRDVARAVLDMGFHISFSGIVTFKNAHELHAVASYVPLDRMLIETDSPYLAPVPFRGKTNTPAYVPHVARHIANLRQCSVEEVAVATSHNFERLFPLVLR